MDISQWDNATLLKYRRAYKLKPNANLTRDDLIEAVSKHFSGVDVDESDAIVHFLYTLRNKGKS